MSEQPTSDNPQDVRVRAYEPRDQAAVAHLYTAGLLAGQIAPNDTGADIENVREAYFDEQRHHFWVAEVKDRVVGMIGVASDGAHTAEIRRLRVDPDYQDTPIASLLLETAVAHCKHHGYLKVRLDTRFERDAAVDTFDKIGFQHTRSRTMHEKELLEFYLDLYRREEEQ
ncbi:MAG: GNAT family N-acetyltransferase [Phycisphaeraceae bacterium]